ncbi:MAG TPA: SDR family NAD(P)-dependent oxidoreductase [Ignavibacteriaceae bacterium]|nr:SDR family NAD(P)-dependent oxidoreductase [Ignavibacteriaceae bacterium]
MNKELLIFGSNGALGKGVTSVMIKKNYDKIYLFDFNFETKYDRKNIEQVVIKDLSIENNIIDAFKTIMPGKDKILFLFSTVGGFAGGKYIWETDEMEIDKMIGMNFKTNFLIAKHFSKIVKESAAGSICFTAAFTGLREEKKKSAYGAAKGSLIHLVKTLASEGEEINLSANAIAPFIIDTPANREWMKEADTGTWMKPAEIGELIHFMFDSFHFISGNVIQLTKRFKVTL